MEVQTRRSQQTRPATPFTRAPSGGSGRLKYVSELMKWSTKKASREAMEIILKLRDQDLAKLPPDVRRLAEALKSQGKSEDAERLYEEAIQVARQRLGESDPVLGELLHDYGEFLFHQENKPGAATVQYIKSLPIRRSNQDDDLAWTLRNLGCALVFNGRSEEAEAYFRESLALYRKLHQEEDINGTAG